MVAGKVRTKLDNTGGNVFGLRFSNVLKLKFTVNYLYAMIDLIRKLNRFFKIPIKYFLIIYYLYLCTLNTI